jgi:hypothetical protein
MSDFWINAPNTLWRFKFDTTANILNSLSLIVIIVTILVSLIVRSVKPFYIGVMVIGIIGAVYYVFYDREPFGNLLGGPPPGFSSGLPEQYPRRLPTPNNPFMNVPITAYDAPQEKDDYVRYDAVPYETPYTGEVRDDLDKNFRLGLFQDPNGRLWDRNNSQREYLSVPVGGVPDKAVEFGQWLYGVQNNGLCKQGSIYDRYGLKHVENNCTGYNSTTPSNFGRKDLMQ